MPGRTEVAYAAHRLPASDQVQIVSTSRHITQGWVGLERLEPGPEGASFRGTSRLVANDPYALRFAVVGDGRELWTSDPVTKASAPGTR